MDETEWKLRPGRHGGFCAPKLHEWAEANLGTEFTSGPDRRPLDGKCDGPVPYVSQAPLAVRSAGGCR
jgi:hypothetical protein